MRFKQFIPLLTLIPLTVFSQPDNDARAVIQAPASAAKYTIEHIKSNETDLSLIANKSNRTIDVPTQIIRIEGDVNGQKRTCKQVETIIDEQAFYLLKEEEFLYNVLISCVYDETTHYASRFSINAYFDPLTDNAVGVLNTYLDKMNGSDLLGTRLNIESAKELIISINLMAGVLRNPDRPPLTIFGQERSNFSFKSNYDMKNIMLTDLYANFYSDDKDKILPFLNRWIRPGAEHYYFNILWDSNYVELQPERIFVMNNDEDIFVSHLRYYFAHQCYKHSHHYCIKHG